jgi:hypothetical protein
LHDIPGLARLGELFVGQSNRVRGRRYDERSAIVVRAKDQPELDRALVLPVGGDERQVVDVHDRYEIELSGSVRRCAGDTGE